MMYDLSDIETPMGMSINEFIFDIGNELINLIKEEAPVDTGRLRSSFQIISVGDGEVILGTNLPYAIKLHEGIPSEVNMESLNKWVRRKLKITPPEPVAVPLSARLEEKGPRANKFVDRAIERLREEYV